MRLLLDTHVAVWAILDDPQLSRHVRDLISDLANTVIVSAASVWEIAIKHSLARGRPNDMAISGSEAVACFRTAGYTILPISAEHAAGVASLPDHHSDPFDRLLVSQANLETLQLVTADKRLALYGGAILLNRA